MSKQYERPSVSVLDTCSFETVCAGSGTEAKACPYGRTAPNANDPTYTCHTCLRTYKLKVIGDYENRYISTQDVNWLVKATADCLRDGHCPAGYSYS